MWWSPIVLDDVNTYASFARYDKVPEIAINPIFKNIRTLEDLKHNNLQKIIGFKDSLIYKIYKDNQFLYFDDNPLFDPTLYWYLIDGKVVCTELNRSVIHGVEKEIVADSLPEFLTRLCYELSIASRLHKNKISTDELDFNRLDSSEIDYLKEMRLSNF